jgi:hypothetical protein
METGGYTQADLGRLLGRSVTASRFGGHRRIRPAAQLPLINDSIRPKVLPVSPV